MLGTGPCSALIKYKLPFELSPLLLKDFVRNEERFLDMGKKVLKERSLGSSVAGYGIDAPLSVWYLFLNR